ELQTHFFTFGGTRVVKAVDRVSFSLHEGETLGLVGESGSGKTTTCLSIVGLLPRAARIVGGSVVFEGEDLTRKSQRELRRIRGRRIAVILQDPMASLNPLFTIGRQVAEPAFFHQRLRGRSLRERVQQLLRAVRIPSPRRERSGGTGQPCTRALLGSAPRLGSKESLYSIAGQPPNLANLPAGCPFHPRCPEAVPRCKTEEPRDVRLGIASIARCWLVDD